MLTKEEFAKMVADPYIGSGGGDESGAFIMTLWQREGFSNEEIKKVLFKNMRVKPSEKLTGYDLYCSLHKEV